MPLKDILSAGIMGQLPVCRYDNIPS